MGGAGGGAADHVAARQAARVPGAGARGGGAAVAFYLGMETLTHLDGDRSRPAAFFDQAARFAAVFDRIPRLRRRSL